MTHFGPSTKSIRDTMLDIDQWHRDQPLYQFRDHAGNLVERRLTEEEEFAIERFSQLYDLTTLRHSVPTTSWKLSMLAGCCDA